MQRQTFKLLAGLLALALLAAACAPATVNAPTSALTAAAPTAASGTAVPATAAVSAAAPATSALPAPTQPAPTDTPLPPSATPDPNAIAHFQVGQPITITTIRMFDAQHGWGIGGLGTVGDHILTTLDGGQTWKDVTPPQAAASPDQGQPNTAAAAFGNAYTAWAIYGTFSAASPASATFWRTSDSGATWTASKPIDLSALGAADFFQPSDIRFLQDAQTGWFIAHLGVGMNHDYFTILKTIDGGQSWSRLIDPSGDGPQSCSKTGLHFADAQNGWLNGDCQGVAPGVFFKHTSDSGATWTDVALPAPASMPDLFTRQDAGCGTYDMRLFDPQHGLLSVSCLFQGTSTITSTHYIYTTADGGKNWTSNPSPARRLTFINPQVGWALPTGEINGQPPFALSQTQDGGATWTTVKQLAWAGDLIFVDAQTGWAVAQANGATSLVSTSDGGKTWHAVNPKVGP